MITDAQIMGIDLLSVSEKGPGARQTRQALPLRGREITTTDLFIQHRRSAVQHCQNVEAQTPRNASGKSRNKLEMDNKLIARAGTVNYRRRFRIPQPQKKRCVVPEGILEAREV